MSRTARLVAITVCALYVVTIIGTGIALQNALLFDLLIEIPLRIKILLTAPMVAAPLTLALPFLALRAFAGTSPSIPVRLHYWLVVLFAFVFLWMCWYWNLLGFQY